VFIVFSPSLGLPAGLTPALILLPSGERPKSREQSEQEKGVRPINRRLQEAAFLKKGIRPNTFMRAWPDGDLG